MDGILLINKPKDWSSFDVVAKVRNSLKAEFGKKIKVGHTGTLDPKATGLLILVIGVYCKRAQEYSKLDKTYEVEIKLGQVSTTGDAEGELTGVSGHKPAKNDIDNALKKFSGEIMQTPPAFSAIKVNGKRAYKLAREGKDVKIEPRKVSVYAYSNVKYDYPYLSFDCDVSSGTYIRSLAQDIGEDLKTGAYLSNLNRTKVGDFKLKNAVEINSPKLSSHVIKA